MNENPLIESFDERAQRLALASLSILAGTSLLVSMLLLGCSGGSSGASVASAGSGSFDRPSRSTSIALTRDNQKLVVVNRESDSVSILRVRTSNGQDSFEKLAEVAVGQDPRCVALTPDDKRVFVTNGASGTVSVIQLRNPGAFTLVDDIPVGTEPRGIATSPSGRHMYVANHTEGTVSVIDTKTLQVVDEVTIGGNPTAVAVSNDGDENDLDETVFVTQFFAERIPGGPGESFDDGKQGVLWAFPASGVGAATKVTLSPLGDVGFTADRTKFCLAFNPLAHSEIFCPDTTSADPLDPAITQDPQGGFPNQLQSIVLRTGHVYLPSIGAGPEPPVQFRVNVQGLVHVVDAAALVELPDLTINLNNQIKLETPPVNPTQSLDRIFANDIVAIDADRTGSKFLIVSRGGNYVIEAGVDANGALSIGAPDDVVRYQTGNLPSGVVMSSEGRRAYVNNEVNISVTVIDLENQVVIDRDLPSGTPPSAGSFSHGVLVGKLTFHTALGVPDFGVFGIEVRDLVPLENRNKASDNGWSSCSSCHPDGLSDNVTWAFATGPRQTVPLDAFFSKSSPGDQRISNYSAIMGGITDFNNNAIGVQGGTGFAGQPPPTTIFNHGITEGASDSLDAMNLWVQTIRPLNQPEPTDLPAFANGEGLFAANCAACHGGEKWTKSQVIYDNNPTFDKDPSAGGVAFDPGVTNVGPQIQLFTEGADSVTFLDSVGTFDVTNPLEIRGTGSAIGQTALGALGFNSPSVLDIRYHAPYLHDGSALTLDEVFARHDFGAGKIQDSFTPQELQDLIEFMNAIDGATATSPSATDLFLETIRGG